MSKFKEALAAERRPQRVLVNVRLDEKTYKALKDKLQRENTTVVAFFAAAAKLYLNEK